MSGYESTWREYTTTAVTGCTTTECLSGSPCCDSQFRVYFGYNWFGLLILGCMVLLSVLCLYGICNHLCRTPQENTEPRQIPLRERSAPPPYREVTSSSLIYPPSGARPPSYNSIIKTIPTAPQLEGGS